MRYCYLLAACSLVLFGCRAKNEEYYLLKGESIQQEIVAELSSAQTLQDLLPKEETLTQLFLELSSLAIRADQWKKKHKTREKALGSEESRTGLEQEFRRVLAVPGAEAFLEKCQKQALDRLDIYLGSH
jgi:hypothetical protein